MSWRDMGTRVSGAVVFDLDGTLVDSVPDLHAALNATLADLGRPPLDEADTRRFVGDGVARLVERALAATGGAGDVEASVVRFRRYYDAAPAERSRPYPGAVAALDALSADGWTLGICTNKPERPARALLAALDLASHFATVVGGDSTATLKPDPGPLRAAFDALGRDGPRLFVGDSEVDAETAAAARVPFALHTEGYRRGPAEAIEACARFDAFDALPALARTLAR